jgi:hypothetical protein
LIDYYSTIIVTVVSFLPLSFFHGHLLRASANFRHAHVSVQVVIPSPLSFGFLSLAWELQMLQILQMLKMLKMEGDEGLSPFLKRMNDEWEVSENVYVCGKRRRKVSTPNHDSSNYPRRRGIKFLSCLPVWL